MKIIHIITTSLLFLFLSINGVWAQIKLGEAKQLFKEGKSKKALEVLEKEMAQNGLDENSENLKSKILIFIDGEKAWDHIQKTIQKYPNSAGAYLTRGQFYYEIRQMQNSINDLNHAYELCKDDSLKFDILLSRSGAYHHSETIQKSIADCQEALKIRPNDISILNNLSTTLFDQGQVEESEKILLQIKAIDSNFIGTYINLGYQMQQINKFDKAKKYLLEGLEIKPENAFLLNNLGYTEFKLGNMEDAIKYINKSLKIYPDNSYAYRNLALIYFEKNDKSKACENINKSLSNNFTEMYGDEVKELKKKYCL